MIGEQWRVIGGELVGAAEVAGGAGLAAVGNVLTGATGGDPGGDPRTRIER